MLPVRREHHLTGGNSALRTLTHAFASEPYPSLRSDYGNIGISQPACYRGRPADDIIASAVITAASEFPKLAVDDWRYKGEWQFARKASANIITRKAPAGDGAGRLTITN